MPVLRYIIYSTSNQSLNLISGFYYCSGSSGWDHLSVLLSLQSTTRLSSGPSLSGQGHEPFPKPFMPLGSLLSRRLIFSPLFPSFPQFFSFSPLNLCFYCLCLMSRTVMMILWCKSLMQLMFDDEDSLFHSPTIVDLSFLLSALLLSHVYLVW